MIHEETEWRSNDNIPLYVQKWHPANEAKGVICLIHGLGEHSSRYLHWAERLTAEGYAVLAFDLRGHGNSGGERGDSPTFDHLTDDITLLLKDAEKQFPNKPCFLYGHSLGGLLVLFYLIQRRPDLAGAIVTSPALHTSTDRQKIKIALARILSRIIPRVSIPNGLDREGLSQDPAVVQAYCEDPLVHDRISLRMAKGMFDTIDYVLAQAPEIKLPLLIMNGTEDRITFASGAEKLADLIKSECTLKLWDGLYHELHNEFDKDRVFDYLKQWLEKRFS